MSVMILRANEFGPLTEARLADFEQELGTELPGEYRAFLLRYNGGVPDRDTFTVPESDDGDRLFSCFFALHDQPWNDDAPEGSLAFPLQEARADFKRMMPGEDALPIGKDWNGNYVCVGLSGADRGRLFFYDHEYQDLVPLAGSLAEFLDSLRTSAGHI